MGKKLNYEITLFENNKKKILKDTLCFKDDEGAENNLLNLYPDVTYQEFDGFGGALTDSAGYVYSKMNDEDKKTFIHTYYDKEDLDYITGRIHIDSCDFSCEMYEAMEKEDFTLESFNIKRTAKYIIPLLSDIQKETGKKLEIMISPWSAPKFMKTNNERCHGGKIKDEYKKLYARYICKYIKELRKLDADVKKLTIQNEPKAAQPWDSCLYEAKEEKEFLRDYLYPTLIEENLSDIEIFIWDHNKERAYERALAIIDKDTDKMIKGIAFHWYSGDHFESLRLIKEKFPDKKLIMSEACIEYSKFDAKDFLVNAEKYAHDTIGNLNNGMNGFYDWNILLDEKGGPNHVGNLCDAPYLYDTVNNKLMERNTLSYIRHFSHYIKPGAKRIAYTKYSDLFEVTSFINKDGKIVVVLLNRNDFEIPVDVRIKDETAKTVLPKKSIATYVIE